MMEMNNVKRETLLELERIADSRELNLCNAQEQLLDKMEVIQQIEERGVDIVSGLTKLFKKVKSADSIEMILDAEIDISNLLEVLDGFISNLINAKKSYIAQKAVTSGCLSVYQKAYEKYIKELFK